MSNEKIARALLLKHAWSSVEKHGYLPTTDKEALEFVPHEWAERAVIEALNIQLTRKDKSDSSDRYYKLVNEFVEKIIRVPAAIKDVNPKVDFDTEHNKEVMSDITLCCSVLKEDFLRFAMSAEEILKEYNKKPGVDLINESALTIKR